MPRRQFKVPFAATGDKISVPDAVQPDGSVSLQEGYGFDYQRDPQTDPLAKVFPRDAHNGLLNEITASIGEIQQNGFAIWTMQGAPYPINSVARHNDQNWQSVIGNNNDEPGVGPGLVSWKSLGQQSDLFNAPIASIASAATVNLSASAQDTSQITITGNATITAFTVAAGRSFVAKFTGSCVISNNAAISTGRGSNIQCSAGDSCILRATSANIVEVIGFTRGSPTQSKIENGYKILHDGSSNPVIIQWGRGKSSAGANITVSYPIAFPNGRPSSPITIIFPLDCPRYRY